MKERAFETGKLYTSAEDFFRLGGSSVMRLSRSAAIDVCLTAASRGLVVGIVEGGIFHDPGFEARLDSVWSGYPVPITAEEAPANNRAAAEAIESDQYETYIVQVLPIGWPADETAKKPTVPEGYKLGSRWPTE